MVFIVSDRSALFWTTPWPAQFTPLPNAARRLSMRFASFHGTVADYRLPAASRSLRANISGATDRVDRVVHVHVWNREFQLLTAVVIAGRSQMVVTGEDAQVTICLTHDGSWQDWEEAGRMDQYARATECDRRNQRAALPVSCARDALPSFRRWSRILSARDSLLECVPVSYVIVDKLKFVDMSRRYARPAVESDPADLAQSCSR